MINKWDEITEFRKAMGPLYTPDKYALALFMEVAELTESFQFKPWRKNYCCVLDRENLKREIVDCLFFLHHIAECFDITPQELEIKFQTVMSNNRRRYTNVKDRRQ